MASRYYWDSCAFISYLQRDKERIAQLQQFIDDAADGKIEIVTSTLSIAEVTYLNKECTDKQLEMDIEQIASFFDYDYIKVRAVTRAIAQNAAKIGRDHKVKPADAIHLATAIDAECPVVHTYDTKKLTKLSGKIGNLPLKIMVPKRTIQPGLFGDEETGDKPEEPEPATIIFFDRISRQQLKPHVAGGSWNLPASRSWGRSASPLKR